MTAERLSRAVAQVRDGMARTYPVLVDTTQWSWVEGSIVVTGAVLAQAQVDAYRTGLTDLLGEETAPRPLVLSDIDAPWRIQDWRPLRSEGLVDIYRSPEGDLQTQWQPPAWIRYFADHKERARSLVQIPDGTLGWVDSERLSEGHAFPVADPWAGIQRLKVGQLGPLSRKPRRWEGTSIDALGLCAVLARARLSKPYRWGGNSEEGADCSGFVQSVLYEATGILLPKHTGDQRGLGLRVAWKDIAPGDLVFVRGRERRLMHVALVLPPKAANVEDGPSVVHSCMSLGQVTEEPLAPFMERYSFVCARRIVQWSMDEP